jgi:hypothetical protein
MLTHRTVASDRSYRGANRPVDPKYVARWLAAPARLHSKDWLSVVLKDERPWLRCSDAQHTPTYRELLSPSDTVDLKLIRVSATDYN